MKSRLSIALLHLFSWLPLPLMRTLGALGGGIVVRLNTRMARTTNTNLALAFPELTGTERQALARASLRNTCQMLFEAGGIWLWPAERVLGCIERVHGFELLQQALATGKGVLVAGPHLGNWELLGLYLSACGCGPSHQMFQPPSDPRLAALTYAARSRAGAHMVPTDKSGVATLLRALRAGEIVGILPDQVPPPESGAFAPFFGVPAFTMTLLNRLQQKTGARVLGGFVRRSAKGFEICFIAPDPRIYADDLPTALTGLNATVEALVRQAPEQYHWEYKRYKRQPPGRVSPYRD